MRRIVNCGSCIPAGMIAMAAAGLIAGTARADIIHADDVIIENGYGLCVGAQCADGEAFGSDTLRLKESVLQIHFDDTSTTAGYANVDWRLIANETGPNGRNIFILEDSTNDRQILSVEAGAPDNSLYIQELTGDVGLGTANPQYELHILDSYAPVIRLEQHGGGFYDPSVWDLGSTDYSFFLRQLRPGSSSSFYLPFTVRYNAPSYSFFIDEDGDVGMGTSQPTGPLDISREGIPFIRLTDRDTGVNWALQNNSSEFRITTPTGPGVEFAVTSQGELEARGPLTLSNDGPNWTALEDSSTGITWNYQNNGGEARITTAANPGIEFALAPNGNLTIQGEIFTAGSCSAGCDRVFEADYDLRSIREHAKLMWTNGYLPAVGPTAEEGSMNLSAKVGGMLNELEHAHIYIAELEAQVRRNTELVESLQRRLAEEEAR